MTTLANPLSNGKDSILVFDRESDGRRSIMTDAPFLLRDLTPPFSTEKASRKGKGKLKKDGITVYKCWRTPLLHPDIIDFKLPSSANNSS